MRMLNPHFVLLSAVGLLSAASCTLITDVDRGKIEPPDTTPQAGSGGSAGKAGSGGAGGSTGGVAGEAGSGGSSGETAGGAGEAGAAGSSGAGGSGGSAGEAGSGGSGGEGGVVAVCTKASGSITLQTVPNTFFQDGDRFTVDDGVNAAVTFEFDCFGGVVCNPPSATEGVADGREPITFDGTEDEAGVAALIVSAINDATLGITARLVSTDDGAGGEGGAGGEAGAPPALPREPVVIELVNELFGDRGNIPISERINNPNFTVSGLSGGEAVSCPATVTACSDDDACESGSCDTDSHLCE